MHYGPSAVAEIVHRFRPCFTRPGFQHFAALLVAWLMARGARTVSRVLPIVARLGRRRHHASVYRFLAEGRWSLDALGRVVFDLLKPWLSDRVLAIVDDTLCAKSGRQLYGTGIHHDSTRSVYNRRGRRLEAFGFGHSWVVLAIDVRCPWQPTKGWAVPVLFRLYRPPRRCPRRMYRKRSELAREMVGCLSSWLGPGQSLQLTGDGAYACKTVLRGLPAQCSFVGPLPLDAALYDTVRRLSGRGRPRRKGYRIASPQTRLCHHKQRWEQVEVGLYNRRVNVHLLSFVGVWYGSAGPRPVRVVITKDPRRRDQGRAYFGTDPDLTPYEILATYARRWQLEVTFRDLKQELGFQDPQNGWWRRPAGRRDDPCRPARRSERGRRAVERTAPLAAVAYAVAIRWYLRCGRPAEDVARVRRRAPWYRHKDDVSLADILDALRRATWLAELRRTRPRGRLRRKADDLWMLAGNAA